MKKTTLDRIEALERRLTPQAAPELIIVFHVRPGAQFERMSREAAEHNARARVGSGLIYKVVEDDSIEDDPEQPQWSLRDITPAK
jgi:hypothetical protein